MFWQGFCDDVGTKNAIGIVWREYGYLCDTHTAVAWDVAQQYKAENPAHNHVVILSTASPFKFPAAVLEGLGHSPKGDEFDVMARLRNETHQAIPKNLDGLKERAVRHNDVIDREKILDYVLDKAAQKQW